MRVSHRCSIAGRDSVTLIMNFVSHMSSEATWAYGCRVLPGASRTFYQAIDNADFRKHSYAYMQGTSMACPHVSGVDAWRLLMQIEGTPCLVAAFGQEQSVLTTDSRSAVIT